MNTQIFIVLVSVAWTTSAMMHQNYMFARPDTIKPGDIVSMAQYESPISFASITQRPASGDLVVLFDTLTRVYRWARIIATPALFAESNQIAAYLVLRRKRLDGLEVRSRHSLLELYILLEAVNKSKPILDASDENKENIMMEWHSL